MQFKVFLFFLSWEGKKYKMKEWEIREIGKQMFHISV